MQVGLGAGQRATRASGVSKHACPACPANVVLALASSVLGTVPATHIQPTNAACPLILHRCYAWPGRVTCNGLGRPPAGQSAAKAGPGFVWGTLLLQLLASICPVCPVYQGAKRQPSMKASCLGRFAAALLLPCHPGPACSLLGGLPGRGLQPCASACCSRLAAQLGHSWYPAPCSRWGCCGAAYDCLPTLPAPFASRGCARGAGL